MTFGHVEYQSAKDDPMGISMFNEKDSPESAAATPITKAHDPQQDDIDQHLDAFGQKGKGKGGWMSNGGKCNVCNGEGHMARDGPSVPGADGKATGDPCFGCNGLGHQKAVCPTANPQLKGGKYGSKGGGKGWKGGSGGKDCHKGSKGKGWGGKGSGKGTGKKGLYDLDLWGGSDSGSSEWSPGWSGSWSNEGNALRSLGCLTEKPVATAIAPPVDELAPIWPHDRVLQSFDELAPIGY